MSGLTEQEISGKHIQSLKEGKQACELLARNQDPDKVAPRGHIYGNLQRSLKALEGSCRQLAHFRSDARWIKLGVLYARAMRVAQAKMAAEDWAAFGKLGALFEQGLVRMDELANRKTGKVGSILPSRPSTWLILPDHKAPPPRRPPVTLQ